jgi:hypothetical protein
MAEPSSGPEKGPRAAADATQETAAPAAIRPRYLWTLLGSVAASFVGYYALLGGLSATGNLPAPAFANSVCVDEKLAHMRDNPVASPNLLVIGSSVAWRHFDGAAVARLTPASVPLNGAFCGLPAQQSTYVADWLLGHHPSVREVLLIASPQDFENCTKLRREIFDTADADAYVFDKASPWPYYIKYFSPGSLLRNSLDIAGKRDGTVKMDPLVFDRYGSGPADIESSRELLYGSVGSLDPACFATLKELAERLRQDGRRLMVASTPLHPEWKALHDPDGATRKAFSTGIRATLAGGKGEFWDSDAAGVVTQDAFYDGIHLRWSAVTPFSEALARHFRFNTDAPMPVSSVRAAKL